MIDVRMLIMSRRSIEEVIDDIFGHGNSIKISRFSQKLYETFPELYKEQRQKTYIFLNFALYDYYRCRRTDNREAEKVKNEDVVAGISPSMLNKVQASQGMNTRIAKGFLVGMNAFKDLKKKQKEDIGDYGEFDEDLEDGYDPDDDLHVDNIFKVRSVSI